jgi:spermidine synthase
VSGASEATPAETIDHCVEEVSELELRRRGAAYDVLVDGRRVLRSDAARGQKELVELALAPLVGRDDVSVLVAGLGMGFTLRAVLAAPGVQRVDVVESSAAIVNWEARHFAALNGDVLKDKRVKLHKVELGLFLKSLRSSPELVPNGEGWMALLLDIDEGPGQLWRPGNAGFYSDDGIAHLAQALRHGGVLATWSPERAAPLMQRLHAQMQNVAEVVVPVDADEGSALHYVYRARRPADPSSKPFN